MGLRSKNCRDEHGNWDIGGGAVEFGDAIIDRLKQEIKEEYCTEVLKHEFLGYGDVHREHEGKKTHWIALYFKCLVDPKTVSNGEPHKFNEIKWFTLDNLPKNIHSQFPKFFKQYGDKLK